MTERMTYEELIAGLNSASLYLQDLNREREVDAISFATNWIQRNEEDLRSYFGMTERTK